VSAKVYDDRTTVLIDSSSSSALPEPYTFNGTSSNNTTPTSSSSPLEAMAGTGFAAAVSADGSGRLLMYYQDARGRIIENSYLNGSWYVYAESRGTHIVNVY